MLGGGRFWSRRYTPSDLMFGRMPLLKTVNGRWPSQVRRIGQGLTLGA